MSIQKTFGTILRDNPDVDKIAKTYPTLTEDMLKNVIAPKNFDGRDQWYDNLVPISDLKECGRGWIFAAVECLSSRYNIFTSYQRSILLSSVGLIYCRNDKITDKIKINDNDSSKKFNECPLCTGSIYYALRYLFTEGAPLTSCVIYEDFKTLKIKPACEYKNTNELKTECDTIFTNNRSVCPYSKRAMHRFRCSMFANIENKESTIMKEIFKNGPVVCSFQVYEDFINEYTGETIYTGPKEGSKLLGGHSGKIVGWGTEKGTNFWIISNSWSDKWGNAGYFKMERGKNVCKIEDNIITVYPDFPVDYSIYPEKLIIKNKELLSLRKQINVNTENYYDEKTIKLIKDKKIKGDLEEFYDPFKIPDIKVVNAGEILKLPYYFKPRQGTESVVKILFVVLLGIVLGVISGFVIYKYTNKIKQ